MPGRVFLTTPLHEIAALFGVEPLADEPPRRNIAPGQQVVALTPEGMQHMRWGMIPVDARIGKTAWTTSLFPKDGQYILPIKAAVRKAEHINEGDTVTVRLEVRL